MLHYPQQHVRPLCRCDNITISPALLAELEASTEPRMLWPDIMGKLWEWSFLVGTWFHFKNNCVYNIKN